MADRVISYDFRGRFTNLTAGLTAASKSVDAFGTKLMAADANGAKMRAGLATLGGAAGKVGLVAAAGLGVAVIAAANFDQAMSKVQAATGESADAMGDLRDAALKAGADTVFSASEAAAGMTALSKAGVSTADILNGGLTGALDLAAAGELDVASAAEIAATTMTQFGLAGTDVSHVADVLAAAAGKAQGEVTDMAGALQYVGPVAAQMGISLEETGGAIAYLATQGIVGQQAGTSLRGMLTALTSPSKIAKEKMDELGISMYDAQGQFVGLDGLAGQLQESMGKLSVAERDEALGRIFGNEQITAARILYAGGSDAITKWTGKVDDSGFAAETAATKLDNLKGDLEALKGSLETALIGTGDGSQGALRSMTQGLTDLVNAFNKLPDGAKGATAALLAVTAVTGGALWFGSKVVAGIASTNAALKALGIQAQITAGSLRAAGGAASVLALAAGYALDSMSIVDSMGRSKDAADSYSTSVMSLAAALQESNVGKWASDLGIDIQLLAEDLYANGESGEYASQVLNDLEESSHGAGAAINAMGGAILPFYTANADKAYDASKDLDAIVGNLGVSLAALPDSVPSDSIWATFYGAADATDEATDATLGYVGAAYKAAGATKEEAAALRDGVKAMREKTSATLAAFDAETQYRQALKAAQQQAKRNDEGIRGSSKAALNNREALSGLAAAWNNQSAAVKNNGEKFREARDAFIKTAIAMGVPEKAAKALAEQILDIPKARAIKITADTAAAKAAAAELKRRIDEATRDRVVTVRIQRLGSLGAGPLRADGAGADGTTVPKTGKPYADRHLYLLADGEEVISNRHGQADRHRPLLKRINAGHLADGGTSGVAWQNTHTTRGGSNDVWTDLNLFGMTLRQLNRALKDSEKAVDKERQQRDSLISRRNDLSSGIQSGLGGDIWAGASDPWAAGATSNPTDALNQSTANGREFIKLIRSLKSKGLDGSALAEVIGSGDLERARMMASLSAKDLRAFEQAFNTNARVLQAAGMTGGNAVAGQQIALSNQKLDTLTAEVRAVQHAIKAKGQRDHNSRQAAADRTGDRVNNAAGGGRRDRTYADH